MLAVINTCRKKYKLGGGLKSCPDLSAASLLELVVPQDVPEMEELPVVPPNKAARLEEQPDFLESEHPIWWLEEAEVEPDSGEGEAGDQGGAERPDGKEEEDQFRDYMLKGE